MKEIQLTRGKVAFIDDDDYERVSAHKWHAATGVRMRWYAASRSGRMRLHRFLLNAPNGMQVDHLNGNSLDCRRANLRLASHSQNLWNRSKASHNTSGFKGVIREARGGKKWCAQIVANKIHYHLGTFNTPEEAAWAYDDAALRLHGEFARLNFEPEERPHPDGDDLQKTL